MGDGLMVSDPRSLEYSAEMLEAADFVPWTDNGEELDPGQAGRIARCEIGEDGTLSPFDAIRLGAPTSEEDPAQGRLYGMLGDGDGNELPENTQIRLRKRVKNDNIFEPATGWYSLRDLDRDRPDHRRVLKPLEKDGKAWFWKRGREVVLEARNQNESVTVDIEDTASILEIPYLGGL